MRAKIYPLALIRIRVIKEGYDTWEKDVMVEAGKGVEVFTMLREKKKVVRPPPLHLKQSHQRQQSRK